MAAYWIWQEHDGQPMRRNVRQNETPDEALARHFKQHDEFRKESPRDRRPLREFIPEVTPGVLRLFVDGVESWSSDRSFTVTRSDGKQATVYIPGSDEEEDRVVMSLVDALRAMMAAEGGEPGNTPAQRAAWKQAKQALAKAGVAA